jgi:glycosyltransferase involved in cell wall biosynthesis
MANKILYVQYTNPACYPSLEHSSYVLAKKNWQILFLGSGTIAADDICFLPHPNIGVRQLSFCPPGMSQKLHYVWFCVWVFSWVLRWRPSWIYASDFFSCPIALILNYVTKIKVIYHEHDFPVSAGLNYSGKTGSIFIKLVLKSRQRLAKQASFCVVPNEQRANYFKAELDKVKKVFIVKNCPSIEEVAPPKALQISSDLWVAYHGSLGPYRLPFAVLKALKLLPPAVKLKIIGYETTGYIGYMQQLKNLGLQLKIENRIEFLHTLPTRELLLRHCRLCNLGLSFVSKNSRDLNDRMMVGASNKPFEYLACGLALLVSDLPEWRNMYVEPGYGLACDPEDPVSIADSLSWFFKNPEKMRQMGELGRQRIIAEWNYEKQFSPILKLLG